MHLLISPHLPPSSESAPSRLMQTTLGPANGLTAAVTTDSLRQVAFTSREGRLHLADRRGTINVLQ